MISLSFAPFLPPSFPFPFPLPSSSLSPSQPSHLFPLPFLPLPPPSSLSLSFLLSFLISPSPPGNRLPRKDYNEDDSSPTPPKRRKLLRDSTTMKKPPAPKNLLGELLMDIPEIDICPLPTQLKSNTKGTRYVLYLLQFYASLGLSGVVWQVMIFISTYTFLTYWSVAEQVPN